MTISFRAYGRRVRIEAPADAVPLLTERLPPSFREDAEGRAELTWRLVQRARFYDVTSGTRALGLFTGLEQAAEALLSDLELWIAANAVGFVFVHAGCVAVGNRAIVLPGRSMSGKSTLTAALVRAGASYLSDEFAVLDSQGFVRPYGRKIALRDSTYKTALRVSPEELSGRTRSHRARVALVARVRFRAGSAWKSRPLTRGTAILALAENSPQARTAAPLMLAALERATAQAHYLDAIRGEADDAAQRLLSHLHAVRD